jgi:hypothetical protein
MGFFFDLSEAYLDTAWNGSVDSLESMVYDAYVNPMPNINYVYAYQTTNTTVQGEVDQGGGITTFGGTFTSDNAMSHTVAVTLHLEKVNYPAFYYQLTDNPVMAVLSQVPYTVVWSVNIKQFLLDAPNLPSAFNQQGQIFEQKFNLVKQFMENTFMPQSESKVIVLQQTVIQAPESPGDLVGTGDIVIGTILLDQGKIINFGDGGKIFPQFP